MTDFKIHFFKENQRIDISQELISLLTNKDIFKDGSFLIEEQNSQIIFNYIDKYLPYKARFSISDVSIIRAERLISISPKFLDINFRLELPFSSPNYFARKLFKIVGIICQKLKLNIYTEFFQDVRNFEQSYLETLYLQIRQLYKQKRPNEFTNFISLNKDKLDQILLYIEQKDKLKDFYKDKEMEILEYQFYKDFEDNFQIAVSWNEEQAVVIPPFVDFVFYNQLTDDKVFYAQEVFYQLDGILEQVPGVSKDCKIIRKEKLRKANKIIHKTNFTKVEKTFQEIDLEKIID